VGCDNECADPHIAQVCKDRVDVALSAGLQDLDPLPDRASRPSSCFGIESRPASRPFASAATAAQRQMFPRLSTLVGRLGSGLGLRGLVQPAPVSTPDIVPEGGQFTVATYSNPAGTRAYKLYIPSCYHGQALPLVVMLHGCTQSPDDFAAGTRMNLIAEEQACLVVYPAQSSEANAAKCWNWFRPSDQQRDQGEPSLIAGITRQVMHDYPVDPQRVYIGMVGPNAAPYAAIRSPLAVFLHDKHSRTADPLGKPRDMPEPDSLGG
jgi:hypothetical protein